MSSPATAIPLVRELAPVPATDADELYDRAAAGEPQAVAVIYDEHHGAVRAFATRLLGDPAAAEDMVHDVFMKVPKALARWRRSGSLRTFLIGIAVNHARHHVRAARRRRAAVERLGKEPPAPPAESPEATLRREELARALQRALDKLPLRQRVAFVLCEIEERTSVEAAQIAGVSEGTIRSRLHHAKAKLRASLKRAGIR
jgi:RNA polymerase sigma-70 factor (ECF subfamily)